jgi:hypothetical protein
LDEAIDVDALLDRVTRFGTLVSVLGETSAFSFSAVTPSVATGSSGCGLERAARLAGFAAEVDEDDGSVTVAADLALERVFALIVAVAEVRCHIVLTRKVSTLFRTPMWRHPRYSDRGVTYSIPPLTMLCVHIE